MTWERGATCLKPLTILKPDMLIQLGPKASQWDTYTSYQNRQVKRSQHWSLVYDVIMKLNYNQEPGKERVL